MKGLGTYNLVILKKTSFLRNKEIVSRQACLALFSLSHHTKQRRTHDCFGLMRTSFLKFNTIYPLQ